MAGNAVLAKPDDRTPLSALWAVGLLEEAGMPHGLIQMVTGPGSELGTPIIEQSDYLMFTGSTGVGRNVAKQAAERLIDCSMELGGKNALLVLDDADVGQGGVGRGAGGVLQLPGSCASRSSGSTCSARCGTTSSPSSSPPRRRCHCPERWTMPPTWDR